MPLLRRLAGAAMLFSSSAAVLADQPEDEPKPAVIAHRGASGYLPEHTLPAYFVAIEQGADAVEPDLVMTQDGVLVVRHENELGRTTDVADHVEFASRFQTKMIDGVEVSGWFTEDFTLAELKTLRARERIPELRPQNTYFDGMFEVASLEEVLELVKQANEHRRRKAEEWGRLFKPVGIYFETKHSTYFQQLGLDMETSLVQLLERHGYAGGTGVYIQSFEVASLKKLAQLTRVPLLQILHDRGRPPDYVLSGHPVSFADLVTPEGLREIARYAQGINANKNLMIPRVVGGSLGARTTLVADAHAEGLLVYAWTFRAENNFLPAEFRSNSDSAVIGDLVGEIRRFLELGIDGFFIDQPDVGVKAVQ